MVLAQIANKSNRFRITMATTKMDDRKPKKKMKIFSRLSRSTSTGTSEEQWSTNSTFDLNIRTYRLIIVCSSSLDRTYQSKNRPFKFEIKKEFIFGIMKHKSFWGKVRSQTHQPQTKLQFYGFEGLKQI